MFIGYYWAVPLRTPQDARIKGEASILKGMLMNLQLQVIQEKKRKWWKSRKISLSRAAIPPLDWSWRERRAWRTSTPPPSRPPPTPPSPLTLKTAVSGQGWLGCFRWAAGKRRRDGDENDREHQPDLKMYVWHIFHYLYIWIYQILIGNRLFLEVTLSHKIEP